MSIKVIIPARSGSKGIPGKNLKLLCGKPLIDYSIETALKIVKKESILISSDSTNILKRASFYGVKQILRPKRLATDTSAVIDTILHSITYCKEFFDKNIDSILLLQPTFPLRSINDLKKAFDIFTKENLSSLVSITKMREHPSECIKIDEKDLNNWQFLVNPQNCTNRQSYEDGYYFINGNFYFSKITTLAKQKSFFGMGTRFFLCDDSYAVDIDNMQDFEYAEYRLIKEIEK